MMQSRWKRRLAFGIGIVAVVAMTLVGFRMSQQREVVRDAVAQARVRTVPVQRRTLVKHVSGTGNISPVQDLQLTFDVDGKVERIYVDVGDRVEAGQVLAELEKTNQELAYLSAKRQYELSKLDFSAPTVVRERELAALVAETQLAGTTMRAPFSGVVATVSAQEGIKVNTTRDILRLMDTSSFFVEIPVDEVDIRHIELGQAVVVGVDAYPDLKLAGAVSNIGIVPRSQGDLVLFTVRVDLTETDPRIRTGMSAEARIIVAQAESVLVVPLESVAESGPRGVVTKVDQSGQQQQVEVRTGMSDGMFVEIVSGLVEGDMVLASNHQMFQNLSPNRSGGFGAGGFQMGPAVRR